MKKVLIVSSVASMIDQFNRDNIRILKELGYEVHVATNFEDPGTITDERAIELKENLEVQKVKCFQIDFDRSPFKIKKLISSFKQLKTIAIANNYELVHLHSPIGGIVGRQIFKKLKTKVIYTAHGFHFFEGAPLKNWLIYYPLEKYFSKYTDILITINEEDYKRSKNKLEAKKVVQINGVGVDKTKFKVMNEENKNAIRYKNGFDSDEFILIYVGELSFRKNQIDLIEVMTKLTNKNLKLVLVGKGPDEQKLRDTVKEKEIDHKVVFLGYRTDVSDLIGMSDVVVSTSKQEGLPVNLIEGLCTGKPLIVSNCRGNRDLVKNEVNGFVIEQGNIELFSEKINKLYENKNLYSFCENNSLLMSEKYKSDLISKEMNKIYDNLR